MNLDAQLELGSPPIVAILRGIAPEEIVEVGSALIDAGIRVIEVPLNSPRALESIERLVASTSDALIGAGTVVSAEAVGAVAAAGGQLVVSPNTDLSVIGRTLERGLTPMPGVMSPTEAFAAFAAGARHLKIFPAEGLGAAHLRALREVLPVACSLWAVGGANASNLGRWIAAGAVGIGIGGSLYRPGVDVDAVRARAAELVAAWRELKTQDARTP